MFLGLSLRRQNLNTNKITDIIIIEILQINLTSGAPFVLKKLIIIHSKYIRIKKTKQFLENQYPQIYII